MAGHPLRPATHLCLGAPLPLQLANGTQAHPWAEASARGHPFTARPCGPAASSSISTTFAVLSQSLGQIAYVLLTRAPLMAPKSLIVRLACIKHAASVRSEPGSNSPLETLSLPAFTGALPFLVSRSRALAHCALHSLFKRSALDFRSSLRRRRREHRSLRCVAHSIQEPSPVNTYFKFFSAKLHLCFMAAANIYVNYVFHSKPAPIMFQLYLPINILLFSSLIRQPASSNPQRRCHP